MENIENMIELKDITKEFKVLNRREGLKGSFQDLFSRDYRRLRLQESLPKKTENVIAILDEPYYGVLIFERLYDKNLFIVLQTKR